VRRRTSRQLVKKEEKKNVSEKRGIHNRRYNKEDKTALKSGSPSLSGSNSKKGDEDKNGSGRVNGKDQNQGAPRKTKNHRYVL